MTINLLLAQCAPQHEALDTMAAAPWLAEVPGWTSVDEGRAIERHFEFDNFYQTMAFVNALAEIAHAQDHHPELRVGYDGCTVLFSTHSAKGLTLNDFICAAQVSALPEAHP
jgi:4a-hydroxytetrahydrobiopterin dehydratase